MRIGLMTALAMLPCMTTLANDETEGLWKKDASLWGGQTIYEYPAIKAPEAGVNSIMIESCVYQGKTTRAFAFWGLPNGASASSKVPAMVLVHGAAGTAYSNWVKNWMNRGYAAISVDTCGALPPRYDNAHRTAHEWSGPDGWGGYADTDKPLTEQWPYHAVAAVIRAHSFLRSLPEVDVNRIGLTGISWGGVLTSCVSGIDDRFAFSAPVYGCAYLYDHSAMRSGLLAAGDKGVRWDALWDAKNFLGNMKKPVLWCTGSNDNFFPLDSLQRSYDLLGNPPQLAIRIRMPHSQQSGDPHEITAFANHLLKGEAALPEIVSAKMKGGKLQVSWKDNGWTISKAELVYTESNSSDWPSREYLSQAVDFSNGSLSASIPDKAVLWWVNLTTTDEYVISTRHFTERGDDLVWTGNAGGEWNAPGNWTLDGETLTRAIDANDILHIDTATTDSKALVMTSATTVRNKLVLGEGMQIISNQSDGVVELAGTIVGKGGIAAKTATAKSDIRFSSANTFEGGVRRYQPGRISLYNERGFGTGLVIIGKGSEKGTSNSAGLYLADSYVIANDLYIERESFNDYNGWYAGAEGKVHHFTGTVTFAGFTRSYNATGTSFYFDGQVYIDDSVVGKSGQIFHFAKPIKRHGSTGRIYWDNGSGNIHFHASENVVGIGEIDKVSDVRIYLDAVDALKGMTIYWKGPTAAANKGTLIDLCGKNQHLADLYDENITNPKNHVVHSEQAATLTLTALGSATRTFTGSITGLASLELDSAGKTYNLPGVAHSTAGALIATAGTIRLYDGASAPNLHSLRVGKTGKIIVDSSAASVRARHIYVVAGGEIALPEGTHLKVQSVMIDGTRHFTKGETFTPTTCSWLKSGEIEVSGLPIKAGHLSWTGAVGGEWNAAGNWVNDQGEDEAPITVGDNLSKLYVSGATEENPLAFTVPTEVLNDILLDAGMQTFDNGTNLVLRGTISGEGGILKRGLGGIFFNNANAANTFKGGVTTCDGSIYGYEGTCFGTGKVTVAQPSFASGAALFLYRGATYGNDFDIYSVCHISGQNTCATIGATSGSSGTLTLTGEVNFLRNAEKANHFRFGFPITFKGTVTMDGCSSVRNYYAGNSVVMKSAGIVFEKPIQSRNGYLFFFTDQNDSTMYFRGTGNAIKWIDLWRNTQCYYLQAKNALCTDAEIRYTSSGSGSGAVMDLCGFDQTVESVCDLTSFDAAHYLKSTGGNRTVLTMNGSASRSSKMVIKDDITVVWNPLSASSVYTFADSAQETTGRFVVKNGEIRFANTSAAKSSGIEVAAGAKFIMDASSSFNPESESLTIEEGASVDFGGRSLKFNVVVYGGKVMPKGSYTHESIPEIAAGSSAVAGEAVAMWNGGAGEGATGIGNAGNWERGMAPDLSAGATLVTFGKGGALATMSGDVAVGGVRFDQQAEGKNSFSVDGTGEFAIGEGGVEVADSSSAKTYGFGVPVKAAASQVWTQRSTVGNRLNFNGGLEIPGGVTVRRNADRSAHLELIGTDERPITIDGKLELDAGFAYLCGGISGSGTLEWWRGDAYTADGDINNLRFLGGIFACDMVWHCENGAKPYQDGTVSFANYTTNVFAGKVTTDSVNQFRPIFGSGSLTEFRGGFDFQYVLVPRGCAGSELVFAGTPGKFSGIVDDTSSYSPHIAFRSAGHDFRSNTITLCGASVIDFEVAGAVKNLQGLNLFGNPQINLHGHDLSAGFIRHSSSYIVNRPHDIVVDSSEGPAKLILDNYQNSAESPIAFTGHAGLRLKGAATGATMTLTAADSTSDGEIELVSGGLKFAADASWRPASRVDVKGGTLTLAHGNVFSKATEVRLEGGTIALDFSGEQEIGILRDANGNQLRRGLYCAMGMTIAGAKPIAGLSGSGTLRVVSKGLMMTIRSKHE